MTTQIEAWSGDFGDAYHERNKVYDREAFWRAVSTFIQHPTSMIEFGCGKGENLAAFRKIYGEDLYIVGVDTNQKALVQAAEHSNGIFYSVFQSVNDFLTYDLAVTRGFLIHVPDPMLSDVFDLLAMVKKNIVMVEYTDTQRREIEYHGLSNMLWADSYSQRFLERYGDKWELVASFESKALGSDDGTTAFVLERKNKSC